MTFLCKNFISTPTISDDLFLVIDHILYVFFISLLSEIFYITYMAIFFKKSLYFRTRNLFTTHFLLSPHTSENTPRNIGGPDAWAAPPPQILGDRPPVLPKSLPY